MRFFDKIKAKFYPKIEERFIDIKTRYEKGVTAWCQANNIDCSEGISFRNKKKIVEQEKEIIKCEEVILETQRQQSIQNNINILYNIRKDYPRGFIVVCDKLLGGIIDDNVRMPELYNGYSILNKGSVRLYFEKYHLLGQNPDDVDSPYKIPPTNVAQLKPEHVLLLLENIDEIKKQDAFIQDIINGQDVDNEFQKKILCNTLRKKYYRFYLGYPSDITLSHKKAILANIRKLDVFIKEKLKEDFDILSQIYPLGVRDFVAGITTKHNNFSDKVQFYYKCVINEPIIEILEKKAVKVAEISKKYPHAFEVFKKGKTSSVSSSKDEFLKLSIKKIQSFENSYLSSEKLNDWKDSSQEYCKCSKKSKAERKEKEKKELEEQDRFETKRIEKIKRENERIERERRERERLEQIKREKRERELARQNEYHCLCDCVSDWNCLIGGLHYYYLLNYFPTTCDFEATEDEWADRYTVWNFKNTPGKTSAYRHEETLDNIIPKIKNVLTQSFGSYNLHKLTLVCIPASNQENTVARYEEFSDRLCNETGMENAFSRISVVHDKVERRSGGTSIKTDYLSFDSSFFKDKYILLFDDVITRGDSMRTFKSKMESLGAYVVAGFSIGKTKHER